MSQNLIQKDADSVISHLSQSSTEVSDLLEFTSYWVDLVNVTVTIEPMSEWVSEWCLMHLSQSANS